MSSQHEGYWSRSVALITRDKGWIKPLLVISAANLVPIVGAFGTSGYGLEWARLISWGIDSAPKQKNVNVTACIRSGARAFVVTLAYSLVITLVRLVLSSILGELIGSIVSLVIGLFGAVLIMVATLRTTIYQSIAAGFEVERISDMVKRDYNGLFRITGLMAAMGAVLGLIASMCIGALMVATMGELISTLVLSERYTSMDDLEIIMLVFKWIGSMLPGLFVMSYILGIGYAFISLVGTCSVGLWMRQFDVRNWGASHDPLPQDVRGGAYGQQQAPDNWQQGAAPTTGAAYDQQQMPTGYGAPSSQQTAANTAQQQTGADSFTIPEAREVPLTIDHPNEGTTVSPVEESAGPDVDEVRPAETDDSLADVATEAVAEEPAETSDAYAEVVDAEALAAAYAEAVAREAQASLDDGEAAAEPDAEPNVEPDVQTMGEPEFEHADAPEAEAELTAESEPESAEASEPEPAESPELELADDLEVDPEVEDYQEPAAQPEDVPAFPLELDAEPVDTPEPAPVPEADFDEERDAWEALASLDRLVDEQSQAFAAEPAPEASHVTSDENWPAAEPASEAQPVATFSLSELFDTDEPTQRSERDSERPSLAETPAPKKGSKSGETVIDIINLSGNEADD